MKVIVFDQDEVRSEIVARAVESINMEPVQTVELEALNDSDTVAVLVSHDSPWEEIVTLTAAKGIPVYLVGKADIGTLTTLKELAKGVSFGVINAWDEKTIHDQVVRNLGRHVTSNRAPARRGLLRGTTPSPGNQAISSNRQVPVSGPSVELQARRMKKNRGDDKNTVRDRITVVNSRRGGQGKSTFSVNFAYALATNRSLKFRVILVDLDVSSGNVAAMLNLPHRANLINWVRGNFKEDLSNLVHVQDCGNDRQLHMLMAPPDPFDAGDITYAVVDKMLSILSKRYDFVIIDTNPDIRALHKACFEWADDIVLVSRPQKPAMKAVRDMENIFKRMHIPTDKVKLVLNMVPRKTTMRIKEALGEIPFEYLGSIPDDPGVTAEENAGGVACLSRRARAFSQAHFQICNKLLGKQVLETSKHGGGILSLLNRFRRPDTAL